MKRPSSMKIGLIITVCGILWTGFVFLEADKIFQNFNLVMAQTTSFDMSFQENGIGFYRISLPDLGDSVFVQIIDPYDNIIDDKKIETKMAINYFIHEQRGIYTIKLTNISENNLPVKIEFGETNSSELRIPGGILFVGILIIIISTYQYLRNYKIAHPEEKIS